MFEILIDEEADEFLSSLPLKSQRIIKEKLKQLRTGPFPGSQGDKERLDLPVDPPLYRLHISHSYTAFYSVDVDEKVVRIDIITTIEQAHKLYGRFG